MATHAERPTSEQPVIGLTGGMCSGKDSWAKFLVEHFDFEWQGTSDIAREYIRAHNLGEPTRDLVREVCAELRMMNGADYLAREALRRLNASRPRVISGLYIVPELEHVRAVGGKIINIKTDEDTLFSRMTRRAREGETGSREEFNRLIGNDLRSTDTDQRLEDVIAMADIEIDGSIPIANTELCESVAITAFRSLGIQYG